MQNVQTALVRRYRRACCTAVGYSPADVFLVLKFPYGNRGNAAHHRSAAQPQKHVGAGLHSRSLRSQSDFSLPVAERSRSDILRTGVSLPTQTGAPIQVRHMLPGACEAHAPPTGR